jgi:hypothetical protein
MTHPRPAGEHNARAGRREGGRGGAGSGGRTAAEEELEAPRLAAAEDVARAVRVLAAPRAPLELAHAALGPVQAAEARRARLGIGLGLLHAVDVVLGPGTLIKGEVRLMLCRLPVEAPRMLVLR